MVYFGLDRRRKRSWEERLSWFLSGNEEASVGLFPRFRV